MEVYGWQPPISDLINEKEKEEGIIAFNEATPQSLMSILRNMAVKNI